MSRSWGDTAVIVVPANASRLSSAVYVPKGTTALIRHYFQVRGARPGEPLVTTVGPRSRGPERRFGKDCVGARLQRILEKAGVEGTALSRSMIRTSVEIAVSLGATREELMRFGRFRTSCPLQGFAHEARGDGIALQDAIEDVLRHADHRSAVKVATAGEVAAAVAGLAPDALVAVSIGSDGTLRIEPVTAP